MRRRIRLFLVLLGAAVVTWALWPRERPLPRIATRVADARDWNMLSPSAATKLIQKQMRNQSTVFLPCGSYHWLSNHEVLVYRDTLEIARMMTVQRSVVQHSGRWETALYDITTRKEQPLTELTQIWRAQDIIILKVSPDGKWVLYWGGKEGFYGASIDGSCRFHFSNLKGSALLWMPDSRRLAEVFLDKTGRKVIRVTLHSVEQLSVPSSRPKSATISQQVPKHKIVFRLDRLLPEVITPENHLISYSINQYVFNGTPFDRENVEIVDTDLNSKTFPTRKHTLYLPPDAHLSPTSDGRVFAPQGDRLAFLMVCQRAPSFAAWIHRLWPSYKATPQTRLELWVCHPDGSQMHEVGHFPPLKNPSDPAGETQPFALQWTPDGKNLSFLYNQALYTVPAD